MAFQRRTIVVGLSKFFGFYSLNRLNFEFGMETLLIWPIFQFDSGSTIAAGTSKVVQFVWGDENVYTDSQCGIAT